MRLRFPNKFIRPKKLKFNFNGQHLSGLEGDTVFSALSAANILGFREDRKGNKRGAFCGMGACQDCLVSINGGVPERACMAKLKDESEIASVDYKVKVKNTFKEIDCREKQLYKTDVMIIGGGPAGLTVADELKHSGIKVMIVDERPDLGGQYFKQPSGASPLFRTLNVDKQFKSGANLIKRVKLSNTKIICSVSVIGAKKKEGSFEVYCTHKNGQIIISCTSLFLASGSYEVPYPFSGWDLPGVFTTGAVQGLVRSHNVSPGENIVVAGSGPLNLQVAAELTRGGARVVCLVEAAKVLSIKTIFASIGMLLLAPQLFLTGIKNIFYLLLKGVNFHLNSKIINASGKESIKEVKVVQNDDPEQYKIYETDILCLGYEYKGSHELASILGAKTEYSSDKKSIVWLDKNYQTSIKNLFLIGDAGIFRGAHLSIFEAKVAARSIIDDQTFQSYWEMFDYFRQMFFQKNLKQVFSNSIDYLSLCKNTTVICRCESITFERLYSELNKESIDLGVIKRETRAGMGRCQGRYCQKLLTDIINLKNPNRINKFERFASQFPIKPVPIDSLAQEHTDWKGYKPVPVKSLKRIVTQDPRFNTFKTNITFDVVIIGGGIIGASVAYFLRNHGLDIAIIEAGTFNSQASGANAGSMHAQILSFDYELGKTNKHSNVAQAVYLQNAGIKLWKKLQKEHNLNLELEFHGGLMVAETEFEMQKLTEKTELEKDLGLKSKIISPKEALDICPNLSRNLIGASFCEEEGKINPLIATTELIKAASNKKLKSMYQESVNLIQKTSTGYKIKTSKRNIESPIIVNASGGWSSEIASHLSISIPIKSAPQQMVVTEACEKIINPLLAHAGRHLTMKQSSNGNIIIGGGWNADYDIQSERTQTLHSSIEGNLWVARKVIPCISSLNILRSWGAVGVTIDGAPVIGDIESCPNFYFAVGANGYTMGPEIGRIVAGMIDGSVDRTEARFFSPSRF